jgi:ABC-2 type transport system permease protein
MAAFDPGLDSYAGRSLYLEAHRQNAASFAEAGELSSAFRLGELSPAFVLQLLLPLVAIVLGHRVWADEAESGRLRLLLGAGVPPRRLAAGKALGLGYALLPFGVLAAVVCGWAVASDPAWAAAPSAAARVALIVGALTLHTAAWVGLTVWVSCRARTAARACAVLVPLWIAGSVVIPRTAAGFAAAHPLLPDKSSFAAGVAEEVRQHGDSHRPDDPHFARFREQALAAHGVSRVEDLPLNYGAMVMAEGERLTAETFARHFAQLTGRMERQAAWIERAGWLAPYLAVRTLSAAAAGTDLRAQLQFQREAEAYRYQFVQRLNELHRDEIRYTGDRDQKLPAGRWREIADFQPEPVSLRESMTGTGWAWAALAAWATVPFLALRRLRVTDL